MRSKIMIAMGAFLMSLGGSYVGRRIGGELSAPAMVAFAIGIILLSLAPVAALRRQVCALESKLARNASADNA